MGVPSQLATLGPNAAWKTAQRQNCCEGATSRCTAVQRLSCRSLHNDSAVCRTAAVHAFVRIDVPLQAPLTHHHPRFCASACANCTYVHLCTYLQGGACASHDSLDSSLRASPSRHRPHPHAKPRAFVTGCPLCATGLKSGASAGPPAGPRLVSPPRRLTTQGPPDWPLQPLELLAISLAPPTINHMRRDVRSTRAPPPLHAAIQAPYCVL